MFASVMPNEELLETNVSKNFVRSSQIGLQLPSSTNADFTQTQHTSCGSICCRSTFMFVFHSFTECTTDGTNVEKALFCLSQRMPLQLLSSSEAFVSQQKYSWFSPLANASSTCAGKIISVSRKIQQTSNLRKQNCSFEIPVLKHRGSTLQGVFFLNTAFFSNRTRALGCYVKLLLLLLSEHEAPRAQRD